VIRDVIMFCDELYDADDHRRRFITEHHVFLKRLTAAADQYALALSNLVEAEEPEVAKYIDAVENDAQAARRRQRAPLHAQRALDLLSACERRLRGIPISLFPEDVFDDVQSTVAKRGHPHDRVTDVALSRLLQNAKFRGWTPTDEETAKILGCSADAVKSRRSRLGI
jgi:hypothetical protein